MSDSIQTDPTLPTKRTPSKRRELLHPKHPRKDAASRAILEDNIGLDEVEAALEFACYGDDPMSMPSKARQLLNRMHDPAIAMVGGKPVAITTHMKAVDMLLPELLELCRQKDSALAIVGSGRRLGKVVDGLGEFAEARWEICSDCGGEGEVAMPGVTIGDPDDPPPMMACPAKCSDGKVRRMGNLDAAKLFLAVHGLGNKSSAPNQTINVNAQAGVRIDGREERKAQQQESVTSRVQAALEGGNS